MKLTEEQLAIINSNGNIKINAVAGSGKTTTIIEYAKARPPESNILYIAFNKSVKLEASKKFASKGLYNVKVETAHSIAYKHIVYKYNYKIKSQSYKTNEIVEILKLESGDEKHIEYILANHINKFIAYFCNSNVRKINELNYLDIVTEQQAKVFVKTFYSYIEMQTRLFLGKMDKGEIEITHDFYLKKFQLSNPQLNFDYILFDEGQDASPAMLDVFLNQNTTKVIVGDTHQQIYGWRFAVNSLEKAEFKTYQLSTSFRFSQSIANLAIETLNLKDYLTDFKEINITGNGESKKTETKAVIARTNLGLLLKAIEYITETKKIKNIYFEGNINSYTYADDGASLYDVLNLYNGKHHLIRDSLIKQMKNIDELEDYIKKTEDAQLGMMVEIVLEYGNEIPDIIKKIKSKHVDNDEKEKAEIIFSTVHRCKGMEYDTIELVNDFITEEKLENTITEFKNKKLELNITKLNEEINLLYVAITRTRNIIYIPETLLPEDFEESNQILITKVVTEKKANSQIQKKNSVAIKNYESDIVKEKTYTVEEAREKNKDAYKPWTDKLDAELTKMYCKGISIPDLAKHFERTKGAVYSRIKKLDLESIYN